MMNATTNPRPDYPRFHLAFPVRDLDEARQFYIGLLGCAEGRSNDRWVDFDFYGHQIVAHLSDEAGANYHNPVDGDQVPVRHFGVILGWDVWHELAEKLKQAGVDFLIEPHVRTFAIKKLIPWRRMVVPPPVMCFAAWGAGRCAVNVCRKFPMHCVIAEVAVFQNRAL